MRGKKKELIKNHGWFLLDNAAKIFPATATWKWNQTFRFKIIFKEKIDKELLQQALDNTMPRFPTFQCSLRKGFFWWRIQYLEKRAVVTDDLDDFKKPMNIDKDCHLFKIMIHENIFYFKGFHSLTDGSGSITFLNTLLKRYIELAHNTIIDSTNTLNINDKPEEGEFEESYVKYANKNGFATRRGETAFHIGGTPIGLFKVRDFSCSINEAELKKAASQFSCSVNQLMTALLILGANNLQKKNLIHYPATVEVPVNLRRFFPSKTIRNFSYVTRVSLTERDYTIAEAVKSVQDQIVEGTKIENLQKSINTNVRDEQRTIVNLVPRCLKDIVMGIAGLYCSEVIDTFSFSSLGKLVTPTDFPEYIDKIQAAIIPPKINAYAVASLIYNGKYYITFSKKIKEHKFEESVYVLLKELGVEVHEFTAE